MNSIPTVLPSKEEVERGGEKGEKKKEGKEEEVQKEVLMKKIQF